MEVGGSGDCKTLTYSPGQLGGNAKLSLSSCTCGNCVLSGCLWAGSELIEDSVHVEFGSCWRGSKLSCSIWTGSENNLVVFSAG